MKKHGIFIKLLFTYIAVVFITTFLVGFVSLYLFQLYTFDNKEAELMSKGKAIADVIKPYLLENKDTHTVIDFLNRADRVLGTEVWVVDNDGKVLSASAEHIKCEGNSLEASEIKEIYQKKIAIRKGTSQFFKEPVLRVSIPVVDQEKVLGAVILYSPLVGLTALVAKYKAYLSLVAFLSLLLATIVGFFLSKYISKPLERMSVSAYNLAKGDLSERVQVGQRDEVGQLGASINFMAEELERQEKVRKDFVADVSHELRSPLNTFIGYIEAIQDGKAKDEKTRERFLTILHEETHRMIRLVNELLLLYSLENKQKQRLDFINLNNLVNKVAQRFIPLAREHNTLINFVSLCLNPVVLANQDKLEQVLVNLVENALKYAPLGSNITVSVIENQNSFKVTIKDEGPGICEEEMPYLWNRFYKVDKARTPSSKGSGLGLAIVKKIIENFNGKVHVSSVLGQGSTFGFSLPKTKGVTV